MFGPPLDPSTIFQRRREAWHPKKPEAPLFVPPDFTDEVIRQAAAAERRRNQVGVTRQSTFLGPGTLARPGDLTTLGSRGFLFGGGR